MKQHRDPDYVTAELHDTQLIIEEIKKALKIVPDDVATHMMLEQEERELKRLTHELEDALMYSRKHTFKLAMQTDKAKYRADKLSEILESFQGFLNKSLQVLKGDANNSRSVVPIYINTTYKGSFGVMMSTDTDDDLFSDKEKAIEYMFNTFQVMDKIFASNENVSSKLMEHFKNNTKLIAKAKRFYKSIADTEDDVKLEWGEYNKESVKVKISNTNAKRFYGYLQKKSDEIHKDIKISGVVKGVSLLKNEIEIVKDDGSSISASFKSNLSEQIVSLLNDNITGLFDMKQTHNTLHDSEVESYELTKILK